MKIEIDTNDLPNDKELVITKLGNKIIQEIRDLPKYSKQEMVNSLIEQIEEIGDRDILNQLMTGIDKLREK